MLTLFQSGGRVRLCPPHYYLPLEFSDLPTVLIHSTYYTAAQVSFHIRSFPEEQQFSVMTRGGCRLLHLHYMIPLIPFLQTKKFWGICSSLTRLNLIDFAFFPYFSSLKNSKYANRPRLWISLILTLQSM